MVIVVGAMVFALFRHSFARALEAALLWVVIALLLAVGYTYRFELRDVADRVLAELVPGRAASRGRTVEIARDVRRQFLGRDAGQRRARSRWCSTPAPARWC